MMCAYACFEFDPVGFWGTIIDTGAAQNSTLLIIPMQMVLHYEKELGQRQDDFRKQLGGGGKGEEKKKERRRRKKNIVQRKQKKPFQHVSENILLVLQLSCGCH